VVVPWSGGAVHVILGLLFRVIITGRVIFSSHLDSRGRLSSFFIMSTVAAAR
jgi:hypothetical protein